MGVKNLWDIIESCKKTLPLNHLQNKRVCIDLSCWMVQLQNVSKSHSCFKEKIYLRGLFHRLRALIALNCSLIFVADGSVPGIKISTYRRRLNLASEVNHYETNSQKVSSLRRNMGSEFSCMIKEAKLLGMALGVPCLDGIEEAEAQCAILNSEALCDGCFTSDSDIFLFGARTVYRDICLGDGGYVVCYEMADIEKQLGFGRNSLITLALLLGSDYSHGVRGLGPESACQIIKSIGDNVILQKIASEGLSFAKKTKGSKKQQKNSKCSKENLSDHEINMNGTEYRSQGDDQFLQVINAFINPNCHSADSDAVYRALVQHPFQHVKVQQICTQFFDWPPEKTDEYILPKMAERDLRRFANLRSTSSELGLKLPLDEMPIKCPVKEIIKQRKVQGKECYEVSWEEQHGLKISIVPADLLDNACPEKIVEFEERKAQKKKQIHPSKARKKKPVNMSSVDDIDWKLENLLLDVECGSNSVHGGPASRAVISDNGMAAIEIDGTVRVPVAGDIDSTSCTDHGDAMSCREVGPSAAAQHEVIDLLSPSPLVRHRPLTKHQTRNEEQCRIDVIDLSDSETDASPKHERKAKELRSFLISIKDDDESK
ncbi:hypothetical protein FNV43_RR24105 [Rhamnella rubrinervis]|uniref:Single-strand DNA endonuclease 1 n=1 Tax=Rhamnella rubrinervis TaxID=2594499 RepID=A0A8K0GQF0_9ROSA|nr:hypothetical protein FNV43_RR24105 [Rhamnella rubrinervis]